MVGDRVKVTPLMDEFDFAAYQKDYGEKTIPLFLIDEKQQLKIFTDDTPLEPQPGDGMISFVSTVVETEQ